MLYQLTSADRLPLLVRLLIWPLLLLEGWLAALSAANAVSAATPSILRRAISGSAPALVKSASANPEMAASGALPPAARAAASSKKSDRASASPARPRQKED